MYVGKTCKSYSVVRRQLSTNWQTLTVAEVKDPVTSLPAHYRRSPQLSKLLYGVVGCRQLCGLKPVPLPPPLLNIYINK